jgi:hypothetical protein
MKTETQEKLVEIAHRVPPGDRWEVKNVTGIQKSLTDALESFFQSTNTKPIAFRLDLANSKLYGIFTDEVEIKEPEPKKYSIYGDYKL